MITMEHNPYITLNDQTEITYSDLKHTDTGEEYITVYFETPSIEFGFCSAKADYFPDRKQPLALTDVIGYSFEKEKEMFSHYQKIAKLAFQFSKEGASNA